MPENLISNNDVVIGANEPIRPGGSVDDSGGDIILRTGGVERARIKADGTGSGWPSILGGSISSLTVHSYTPEDYGAVGDGVTNDTAAWQACIDAAYAAGANAVIRCGHFSYALESAPRHDRDGNAILALPPKHAGSSLLNLAIIGFPGGTQFYTHVTGQTYSASYGTPSLIGGPTLEQTGTAFQTNWSGAKITMKDIQCYLLGDSTVAGIDLSGIDSVTLDEVEVFGLAGSSTSAPASIWQFGIRLPEGLDGRVKVGRIKTYGTYAGVVANTSHVSADYIACSFHVAGMAFTGNQQFSANDGHASFIQYLITQECTHHLASWDPTVGVESLPSSKPVFLNIGMFDIEDGIAAKWYTTTDNVLDANNQFHGEAFYSRNVANVGPASGITVSGTVNFDLYDANGQKRHSRDQMRSTANGLVAEVFNPGVCAGSVAPSTQVIFGGMVGLRAGDVITGIVHRNAVAAAGTNPTTVRFGIADSTGKVLAVSGNYGTGGTNDATTIFALGANKVPLSAPYTVPADGGYYLCFVVNGTWGTTQPTPIKSGTTQAAFAPMAGVKAPSVSVGGQTDLPAVNSSFAVTAGANPFFWIGAY